MNSLGQLWRAAAARIRKPFRGGTPADVVARESVDERGNNIIQLERVRDELTAASKVDHSRLAGLERQLADLEAKHDATGMLVRDLEMTLAATRSDLEHTHVQIRALERQVDDSQQLYLQSVQETQLQIRKQDMRLNWLMLVSGLALLMAATASAILVWDVRKNAGVLAGMSADIKQLTASIQQSHNRAPVLPGSALANPDEPSVPTPPAVSMSQPGQVSVPPLPKVSAPALSTQDGMDAVSPSGSDAVTAAVNGDKGKDEVRRFFERNAGMPDMVSLPSGVQYRPVKQGSGKSPSLKDWVVVDYLGMTRDGSIFDNTYESGQRAIFGIEGLPPVWQEPILQMREGAEFEVYVPPGNANIGGIPSPGKPEGEPGIYLIELIHVVETGGGG